MIEACQLNPKPAVDFLRLVKLIYPDGVLFGQRDTKGTDDKRFGVYFIRKAVNERVFDNRLKNQSWNVSLCDAVLHLNNRFQILTEAGALDRLIIAGLCNLLLQGRFCIHRLQRIPEHI
jgi:hypothetical protein